MRADAAAMLGRVDLLVTDVRTGRTTGLARTVRRALASLAEARVPHVVIDATALAVRGLPRMTRALDVAVMIDDGAAAIDALRDAGLRATMPTGTAEDPEPMIVFVDPRTHVEVDLLIAAGDPEATAIDQASPVAVFGARAPVATLENLLLLYLYSNQPKHLGDFAAIVQSGRADLARAERTLALMHEEMLGEWRARVKQALAPAPSPARPPPRPRRKAATAAAAPPASPRRRAARAGRSARPASPRRR